MEAARVATLSDVTRVTELAHDFRAELLNERGGKLWATREARPEPLAEALTALVGRDDASILVGTLEGHVVGYGIVQIERLRDGDLLGIIEEIYVQPEARAVGIGEILVKELVGFCVSAGCSGVDAAALPGHRQAKNFFERAGFTARLLVMHHPV
jgi:ribosomal protein S18 acetylase RimI-like enzyme